MAVLAGRKHYCVNNQVARSGSVDEGCNELIKKGGMGCAYKSSYPPHLPTTLHDIEDLKKQVRHKPSTRSLILILI